MDFLIQEDAKKQKSKSEVNKIIVIIRAGFMSTHLHVFVQTVLRNSC